VLAAVIKDFGLIDMMNARLGPDPPEGLTPGEAMAGMMLNGLGFAHRPWSLTPQFFASTPRARLFHDGIRAELFNRFTRGRTLDEAYADGCDLLVHALALCGCARDGIDRRFHPRDTTSFSLTGEYVPDSDEQAMTITHGYSREHRPDVKQAVLERLVSQDGGIPCVSQRWDGNPSDIELFQARTQALRAAFQSAPSPRYLIADSTRYHEANAPHLRHLGFITRLPNTMGSVSEASTPALALERWARLDAETRDPGLELCHDGMAQRWLVVDSQAALERAAATLNNASQRDDEAIHKPLFHRRAPRFATPEAAPEALTAFAKGWTYHLVDAYAVSAHQRDARTGRPTPSTPVKSIAWHIQAHVRPHQAAMEHQQHYHACLVIGTTIGASAWGDTEVIAAYKRQSRVAGGVRLLKDPRCVVSSLLVKKPCRIQGLLMVMTRAWLVYSVAQRRLRQELAHHHETVPNHINQPTMSPTLRGVCQLLEGLHRVRVTGQGQVHDLIEGLNDVQMKVLRLFGEEVCRLYQISPG
jgi:transposase